MTSLKKSQQMIHRPWFAFLSSMRFAVALLSVLAIASIIGTVLQQNQSKQNYVVKFGTFWAEIFDFLGLFDVYASSWFIVIMLFLVLSTSLCLWRNIPTFLREMRSFRTQITAQSLANMKFAATISGSLNPDVANRYLNIQGFKTKILMRDDGGMLIAAKKGNLNKWGYIFAHVAIIVICLGGLIDSNLLLKIGVLTGKIVPDEHSQYVREFQPQSILSARNLSFRGNVEITEGQTADVAFLNTDSGLLLQQLPFSVQLKKFHIDFYDTGMPKDFASDVLITDKATGAQFSRTIRVNHPFTYQGVTIYQSTYGDGGSDISFKSWNLRGKSVPAQLQGISQRAFPLDLGSAGQYQLEFGELRPFNVENISENQSHNINNVVSEKKFKNVGATISFKLRDKAGQAHEYVNYMTPLERDGALFFATGERTSINAPYRWLMIPADPNGKIDSFMSLRNVLMQPEKRQKIVTQAVMDVSENVRGQFTLAVENLLRQFSEGGYIAINEHIKKTVPANEQEKTGEFMYQVLYGAMNIALNQALADAGLPEIVAGETRNRFILNSLDAYTALTRFDSPILLQLDSYRPVNMSGMQITKSPGATLVYLGSLLLVLGTLFMFYVREKRIWLLFTNGEVRFAMSATRSERDLLREFPEHQHKLETLAQDLPIS